MHIQQDDMAQKRWLTRFIPYQIESECEARNKICFCTALGKTCISQDKHTKLDRRLHNPFAARPIFCNWNVSCLVLGFQHKVLACKRISKYWREFVLRAFLLYNGIIQAMREYSITCVWSRSASFPGATKSLVTGTCGIQIMYAMISFVWTFCLVHGPFCVFHRQ